MKSANLGDGDGVALDVLDAAPGEGKVSHLRLRRPRFRDGRERDPLYWMKFNPQ